VGCGIRFHFVVVQFAQQRGEYSLILTSLAQLACHKQLFEKNKTGFGTDYAECR